MEQAEIIDTFGTYHLSLGVTNEEALNWCYQAPFRLPDSSVLHIFYMIFLEFSEHFYF